VAAQEAQLAQMAATLPPLLKQLAQQRDLLTVLAGGFPDKDLPEKFELSNLQLPQELPVSIPRNWWSNARMCGKRKRICIPPAP